MANDSGRKKLTYRGNEASWECVNGQWLTNEGGDLISPADSLWSMDTHTAFYTAAAYRDCRVYGKWKYNYAGGAQVDLIVRAMDSRRFYAVQCNIMGSFPDPSCDHFLSVSIWKGCQDGYRRMLAIRRKVGFYSLKEPYNWYDISVETVGNEIIAYFGENFVCAARDDDYPVGVAGVDTVYGVGSWRDLAVEGEPVEMSPKWHSAETDTPCQFRIPCDPSIATKQYSETAALLENDEIVVGFNTEEEHKMLITRSADHGLSWETPVPGHCGYYLKNREEMWAIKWEHRPEVEWHDMGTNFDELNMDNFWFTLSRSKDKGRTWSVPVKMDVPFPEGKAYEPIKGRAGSALVIYTSRIHELSDGSVGVTAMWRNNPDGNYHSDQVQFLKTFDDGKTWSLAPVDGTHWEGNESSFVEFDDGELLCIIRSNYSNCCWESRSYDHGRSWSKVRPLIAFFGSSFPSLIRMRNGVLLLSARGVGLFTSTDNGWTWNMPVDIRGYSGSGNGANFLQMSDGRILVINSTHGNAPPNHCRMIGQFIEVDEEGEIHPAMPGKVF